MFISSVGNNNKICMCVCVLPQVKEEASHGRYSDTLHLDPSGLVTLTTPNRQATLGVCATPLPEGQTHTDGSGEALINTPRHWGLSGSSGLIFMLGCRDDAIVWHPRRPGSQRDVFDLEASCRCCVVRGDPPAGEQHRADPDAGAGEPVCERGETHGRQSQDPGGHRGPEDQPGEPPARPQVEERRGAYLGLWTAEVGRLGHADSSDWLPETMLPALIKLKPCSPFN